MTAKTKTTKRSPKAKRATRRHATPFETVTKSLGQLDRPQLEELADMVAALLEAQAEDEEIEDQTETVKADRPAARGHVEAKIINNCGPYLYLRYWSGKTLKSKYIGKAKAKK